MKCWPSCALGSKQPNCKCLLPSSEAVGNTQTIEPDSASKQKSLLGMLQGKMPYLSSFSAAGIVTCQFLPQQSGLIEGSDCKVSLECKEIQVILTIHLRQTLVLLV